MATDANANAGEVSQEPGEVVGAPQISRPPNPSAALKPT